MSKGLGKVEHAIYDYLKERVEVYDFIFETRTDIYNPGCVYMSELTSVKQLVKSTGYSEKSVLRAINSLSRKHLIKKYKITTKNAKTILQKELLKESKSNWIIMVKLSKLIKRIFYAEVRMSYTTEDGKKKTLPYIKREYIFHPHSKISKYDMLK